MSTQKSLAKGKQLLDYFKRIVVKKREVKELRRLFSLLYRAADSQLCKVFTAIRRR